jgi:hypothetical protein
MILGQVLLLQMINHENAYGIWAWSIQGCWPVKRCTVWKCAGRAAVRKDAGYRQKKKVLNCVRWHCSKQRHNSHGAVVLAKIDVLQHVLLCWNSMRT